MLVAFTGTDDAETTELRRAALEALTSVEGGDIFFVGDFKVLLRVDEGSYPLVERLTGLPPFLFYACSGWEPPCSIEPFPFYVEVQESGRDDFVAALEDQEGVLYSQQSAAAGTVLLHVAAPPQAIQPLSERPEVESAMLESFGPVPGSEDVLHLGEAWPFRVEARWQTSTSSGAGVPVQWTTDTGAFYFFRPDNVELTVKVLDGCALTGHYWVFAAGMTNVGVELTVSSQTVSKTYYNDLGHTFETITDTLALPCE